MQQADSRNAVIETAGTKQENKLTQLKHLKHEC